MMLRRRDRVSNLDRWQRRRRSAAGSVWQMVSSAAVALWRNGPLVAASMLCAAVALSLAAVSVLVSQGVADATARWSSGVETIVFVDPGATGGTVERIGGLLAQNPDVAELIHVDQNAAYAEFAEMFDTSPELVRNVDAVTLPSSWRVVPHDDVPAERVGELAAPLAADGGGWVDGVYEVIDSSNAATILSASAALRRVLVVVAVALIVCAAVLAFTAARASAFARREELAVMRLVGAPRWMVRAPFVVEGAVTGAAGGGAAAGVVWFGARWLHRRVERDSGAVSGLLQYVSVDQGHVAQVMAAVIAAGAAIGAAGAFVAARRHVAAGDGVGTTLRDRAAGVAGRLRGRRAGAAPAAMQRSFEA